MKGRNRIFALLTILFLFLLSPHSVPATPEVRESSLASISFSDNESEFLSYQRVLIDGVWWILIYDGLKLIDAYPE